jgi:hypothetical protein
MFCIGKLGLLNILWESVPSITQICTSTRATIFIDESCITEGQITAKFYSTWALLSLSSPTSKSLISGPKLEKGKINPNCPVAREIWRKMEHAQFKDEMGKSAPR